jgi:shikimate dehydrogenase
VSIDGQTQLVGIVGWPVAHTLSPAMHNAAFSYAGLNWRYVPLPVRSGDLAVALRGLAALGFRGVNVTVPHKVDVIPLLDTLTEAVNIAGAVNTIRIDRNTGRLEGLNTDMTGFLADLAANQVRFDKTSRVLILGAGGAARAAAVSLVRSGAHVIIANRTLTKAQTIVRFMQSSWAHPNIEAVPMDSLPSVTQGRDLIINATRSACGGCRHLPGRRACRSAGCGAVRLGVPPAENPVDGPKPPDCAPSAGSGMLVYQGASAYEVWTGRKAPDVMKMICQQNSAPG